VYDGLNRRRINRDYVWTNSAWLKTNETRIIYDGYLPVQERDINDNVLVTYTRGTDFSGGSSGAGGIGGLLARTDGNGSIFYHADGSGNVTAMMDGYENIVGRYLDDPFGKTLGMWGKVAPVNVMQFSSKPRYHNLDDFGFRWLTRWDRWANNDPIQELGGINLYGFVGNNPLTSIDPFGLDAPDVAVAEASDPTIAMSDEEIAEWKAAKKAAEEAAKKAEKEAAQCKKLSPGEIKKLKDAGHDVHDLKPNSKFDLFKDKNGNILVKPKNGVGPGEPTGININNP